MEHRPLREYIFANYNEDIAIKYQRKPCIDIPSGYNHNLDNIRLELQGKTGSRTDEQIWIGIRRRICKLANKVYVTNCNFYFKFIRLDCVHPFGTKMTLNSII